MKKKKKEHSAMNLRGFGNKLLGGYRIMSLNSSWNEL